MKSSACFTACPYLSSVLVMYHLLTISLPKSSLFAGYRQARAASTKFLAFYSDSQDGHMWLQTGCICALCAFVFYVHLCFMCICGCFSRYHQSGTL